MNASKFRSIFIEKFLNLRGCARLPKKTAKKALDLVFEEIILSIKKDKEFLYPGFGKIKVRHKKRRSGRNPQTGSPIIIESRKTLFFKPALSFLRVVNPRLQVPNGIKMS